jgi:ABC-2 type transport system permease protein
MRLLLIAWQDVKRSLRDPVGIVLTLAVPAALIVAIGMVAGSMPFGKPPLDGFDALSYIAPGMALFFMMFSVRQAARTMAEDAARGVSDRLRASPASNLSVRAGTMVSHVALLFLQLLVLVGASTILYGLQWGPPLPVLLLCGVISMTAAGWVAVLAAVGRTPSRIGALGTALTLIFGIVSRSFAAVIPAAPWMDGLARLTPNYWGLHGFSVLALGGGLSGVAGDCAALAVMCVALWALAALAGAFNHGRE